VPFATTEELADALVNYVHGQDAFDDDRDTDVVELRKAVLGDIFHSNPVVIGPPPLALAHEQGYGPITAPGSYFDLRKHRSRRIYVGANDGMLHAFEAGEFVFGDNPATPEVENDYYSMGNGNEVFGYVPGLVRERVKFIPRNNPRSYYYVDGSPSATDVWLASGPADTTKEPDEWTTVVVTGLRQGGSGYFALDVTDPTATGGTHGPYPKLLWEFNDPNEPLGESWPDPILTRVKVAAPAGFGDHCGPDDGDGDCLEQWVMIVGGGFLAESDPNLGGYLPVGDPSWSDDSKSILIVRLDTGTVLAKLEYDAADPVFQNMSFGFPSTPAVLDLDFDGFADNLYIGDMGGQLWKWDISAVGQDADSDGLMDLATWPAGIYFKTPPADFGKGVVHYRSIFFAPSAAFVEDELTLAFGTGERTDLNYPGDSDSKVIENNRFYVIQDPVPTGPGSIPATPHLEADLSDITGLEVDPDLTDLGFYFTTEDGEKFVTNHIIFAGFVITTSYLPDDGSTNACESAGFTFVHIFDLLNGEGFFPNSGSGPTNLRSLKAGVGVPTDPKITISKGGAQVFVKTSIGQTVAVDAPDNDGQTVQMVYWKQDL
jgi:type IV pilus assembly protein PilY1